MISVTTLVLVLFAHFFADFFFQSDWMAVNKSKDWWALSYHVGVYTLVLATITPLIFGMSEFFYFWAILNGALHFGVDAITSRINAWLWKTGHRHWFFVSIGFDQLIHYLCLFLTIKVFI